MHTSHFLHSLVPTFSRRVCRAAFVGFSQAFRINLHWDKRLDIIRYTIFISGKDNRGDCCLEMLKKDAFFDTGTQETSTHQHQF